MAQITNKANYNSNLTLYFIIYFQVLNKKRCNLVRVENFILINVKFKLTFKEVLIFLQAATFKMLILSIIVWGNTSAKPENLFNCSNFEFCYLTSAY